MRPICKSSPVQIKIHFPTEIMFPARPFRRNFPRVVLIPPALSPGHVDIFSYIGFTYLTSPSMDLSSALILPAYAARPQATTFPFFYLRFSPFRFSLVFYIFSSNGSWDGADKPGAILNLSKSISHVFRLGKDFVGKFSNFLS